MTDDAYYLKRIPQSEYRRSAEESERKDDSGTYIDLSLENLNITDPELNQAVMDRIYEEGQQMVRALLPEEKQTDALTQENLKEIYVRLGLL